MQQSWGSWAESAQQFVVENAAVGTSTYQETVNTILARLHKANLNYINIGAEQGDYVITTQVNVGQQPRRVLLFCRVWYREVPGGAEVRIAVRA